MNYDYNSSQFKIYNVTSSTSPVPLIKFYRWSLSLVLVLLQIAPMTQKVDMLIIPKLENRRIT